MTSAIETVIQGPSPGDRVELFEIDLTAIDPASLVIRCTSNQDGGNVVYRGGVPYLATPLEGDGFDLGGEGKFPRPSLSISNVALLLNPFIWAGGDLIGATVTRIVTLSRYLDGKPDADPLAEIRRDVYTIEQKTGSDAEATEFLLVAEFDQAGKKFPGRQAFADVCLERYRVWDATAGAFDYTAATCPYTGVSSFDMTNAPTTDPNDVCSKNLAACKLRFPAPARLESSAFPGLSPAQ